MTKLALLFALAYAPAAWAQYGEVWFDAGETIYKNNGLGSFAVLGGSKDDIRMENGFSFGFRVAFNGDSLFGHEVMFAHNRAQLAIDSPTGIGNTVTTTKQTMGANIMGYNYMVYANHEGNRFRPFATGGVYWANFTLPGQSSSYGGNSKFGISYGGGIKIRLTDLFAMRLDARQYTNPKPFQSSNYGIPSPAKGWLKMNELSVGFGIVF
jgi:hypothetical protein